MVPVRPGPGNSGFPTLDPGTRDLERAHRTAFWTADPRSWSSRELALSPLRDRRRLVPEIVRPRP
eukprot:scaffold82552_cov40-Phaeocystis_antarctica.AAC.1